MKHVLRDIDTDAVVYELEIDCQPDTPYNKRIGLAILKALAERLNFQGLDLRDADLSGCDLSRADFTDAILAGADLAGANLDNAIFLRAQLGGANLSRASLKRTDLRALSLRYTNLCDTCLFDAHFTAVNLMGAILGAEQTIHYTPILVGGTYQALITDRHMLLSDVWDTVEGWERQTKQFGNHLKPLIALLKMHRDGIIAECAHWGWNPWEE